MYAIINLINSSYEYCPTESSAGGTLLYIGNNLLYKPRNNLCIYKTAELESAFIELINIKKLNIIIGAVYRHPNVDLVEFNGLYYNALLDKISRESKSILLLGDFNVGLIEYDYPALTMSSSTLFLLICCYHKLYIQLK